MASMSNTYMPLHVAIPDDCRGADAPAIYLDTLPLHRLGSPERDECYAFASALALGGAGTSDTLQKVKLREHLAFLASLVRRPDGA
jgi:hypothetical protein